MIAILFMAFVLAVPLSYMGYNFLKKAMHDKSVEITDINSRIAEMILEKKAAVLHNALGDIEYTMSVIIDLYLAGKVDSFETKMLDVYDNSYAKDIDIFFFQSANGSYIFDASNPYYDTSKIKNYMTANNRFLKNSVQVIQSESTDGTLIALTGAADTVSSNTGEIAGYLFAGVILNNASQLINEIIETTRVSEAALIYGDSIVAGFSGRTTDDIIQRCYNNSNGSVFSSEVTACTDLHIGNAGVPIKFYQSLPDTFLSQIRFQNKKMWMTAIAILIFVTIISGYLVNIATVNALYKLIDYTHLQLAQGSAVYKPTMIYEFNKLASQIEAVTCNLTETQAYMHKLIDSASAPIAVWDAKGNITLFNSAMEKLSGFRTEDVLGKHLSHIYELFPGSTVPSTSVASTESNENNQFETLVINKITKEQNHILWNITDVFADGSLSGTILQGIDISEIKIAEEKTLLASKVFENASDGIVILNNAGIIVSCNDSFIKMTGYDPDDIIGSSNEILRSESYSPAFYENIKEKVYRYGRWTGELFLKKSDNSSFPAIVTISVIRDQEGGIADLIVTMHDITERKKNEEHIRYQATHDSLTGLPNRNYFLETTASQIEAYDGFHGLAVLFLDLDRFKNLNETLGHSTGDKVLQIISKRLKNAIDEYSFAARFSGDEFTILITNLRSPEDANIRAAGIIEKVLEPVIIQGYELFIQTSAGLSTFPENGKTAQDLVKNAEIALYEAKLKGRNNLQNYTSGIESVLKDRLIIESKLNRAIQNNEFSVYYQPKIDLVTESVMGMEALLRWNNPELGFISPDKFIALAEENGLILPIGQWVIERALEDTSKLHDAGFSHLKVAVNLSLRQFMQKNLLTNIKQLIEKYKINDFCLEFEITENIFTEDLTAITNIMTDMNKLGINFAIDDFGTGYSSIGYLKKMPISTIKIDRSYISTLESDPDNESIVSSVILMSKRLGLSIVAEGAETHSQVSILKEMGCNIIQGYYYGRPMPIGEFVQFLKNWG